MHSHSKLVLAGLAATLLMAFAVSSASAGRLSVSNQSFRVVWNPLTFTDEAGNSVVECPVTLEGTFHSTTITKIRGSLIGYVTRAISGATEPPCVSGSATLTQASLPWHLTYESFSGTLPNITRVRLLLRGVAFRLTVFGGVSCGYREQGAVIENAAGEANLERGLNAITLALDTTIRLRKTEGIFLCPERAGFAGSGQITLLGSTTTRIRITLI